GLVTTRAPLDIPASPSRFPPLPSFLASVVARVQGDCCRRRQPTFLELQPAGRIRDRPLRGHGRERRRHSRGGARVSAMPKTAAPPPRRTQHTAGWISVSSASSASEIDGLLYTICMASSRRISRSPTSPFTARMRMPRWVLGGDKETNLDEEELQQPGRVIPPLPSLA
ncbi:unnamed protein product, partial [Urochloa humidicola]